jgi:hypothetical protein
MKIGHQVLVILILAAASQGCRTSFGKEGSLGKSYDSEPIKYFKEDSVKNESLKIKNVPKGVIMFYFFEEFNDTLCLYINNKKRGEWMISSANNPTTSSGYSGINYTLELHKSRNVAIIKLKNQKKVISFEIDKNFPLYTIQRYNSVWYVNARKQILILQ